MPRPSLPKAWAIRYASALISRAIGKVEDQGANRGQIPDYCAKRNGGEVGQFWCCHYVCSTGRDQFGKAWPLLLSGSCSQQREYAKRKGALRTRAQFDAARAADPDAVLGWLMLVIDPTAPADGSGMPGHAHHIGAVCDVDEATGELVVTGPRGGFLTVEGNAADPKAAASRNGDGAYHGRERGHSADATTYEFIDPSAFA